MTEPNLPPRASGALSSLASGSEEWREMADALPVLVSYLVQDDGDVRYAFVNSIYETWFSRSREEIIGRPVRDVVGPAAYAAVEGYIARALDGERLSFEQLMPYADGPPRDIRVEYVPRRSGDRVVGVYALVQDVTEAKRIAAELRESEEDFRYAAELNPQVAWTALPDGQLDRVARRWREWTGTSGLGASYAEGLHPDDVQRTFETWGQSVATGEPYDIVHRVRRTEGHHRWIRSRAFPRRDAAGRIVRWYGTTEDIHEQKTAEDHLKLMVLELNHRVKNNLATVQAIAQQTLRGSSEAQAAGQSMLDRIAALAAAHDLLTREQWDGAGISEVAHAVLDPLTSEPGRILIEGPVVRLTSQGALSLSMAFHELGTNALKYGALSNASGRIRLQWTREPSGALVLTWMEQDGPPVAPPTRRGFGTRLLERGVAGELKAVVELDYRPEGLVCVLRADLP